jgi:hypothetical protein
MLTEKQKKARKEYLKKWHVENKERLREKRRLYYIDNKERIRKNQIEYLANGGAEKMRQYNRDRAEIASVRHHYGNIVNIKTRLKSYEGMPFYDGWNPRKGGSYRAGEQWIIENLGKRPKGCSLHIVEHEKGFVPGNLEWTHPKKQKAEQMFKIIANQKHRIKQLEEQLRLAGLVPI